MEEKLLDILEDICDDDIFRDDFDMDLFEEGLMDSLAIAELIVAIEETFSITLPPTEYGKEEFATVNRILKILREKGAC